MKVNSIPLFKGKCQGCQPLKPLTKHHDPVLDSNKGGGNKIVIVLIDDKKGDTFERVSKNMIEPIKVNN